MIRELPSGARVVVLGQGTTMISTGSLDEEDCACVICFSNSGPSGHLKIADLPKESVLIQIDNMQGALSYIRAVYGVLKTWPLGDLAQQIEQMEQELIAMIEQAKAIPDPADPE